MDFKPPRCPNRACAQHHSPETRFYIKRGHYEALRHAEPQQRYRCKTCRKSFSRQTFRHDRGDRRPHLNVRLLELVISGVGFRQIGRMLRLDIHSVQLKHRKLARTCGFLHQNLSRRLPPGKVYLMDEEETYEQASIRPLTVPLVIERESWFLVASAAGSIRRLAPQGTARRARQDREEAALGPRPDESNACVLLVLQLLAEKATGLLALLTDEKQSYRTLANKVFGDRAQHVTTSGKLRRDTRNPLFPINTTIAMTRDNNGRLRRKSWLVTKKKERLEGQLDVFTVYRNYVRQRFNRDEEHQTPAWFLSLLPRNLSLAEVVGWRQDWGERSPPPIDPVVHATANAS